MAFYYVISEVVYNLHIHLAENMLLSLGLLSLFFHRTSCYERVMSYLLKSTFEKKHRLPI